MSQVTNQVFRSDRRSGAMAVGPSWKALACSSCPADSKERKACAWAKAQMTTCGLSRPIARTKFCHWSSREISDCLLIYPTIRPKTNGTFDSPMQVNDVVKYSRPQNEQECEFRFH